MDLSKDLANELMIYIVAVGTGDAFVAFQDGARVSSRFKLESLRGAQDRRRQPLPGHATRACLQLLGRDHVLTSMKTSRLALAADVPVSAHRHTDTA
jgi:hypothetical protein